MTAEKKGAEIINHLFSSSRAFTPKAAPEANDPPPPNDGWGDVPPNPGPDGEPANDAGGPKRRTRERAADGLAGDTPPGGSSGGPPPNGPPRGGRLLGLQGLPDDCPVVPLGLKDKSYFYLDVNGQLQELLFREHNKNAVRHLFGDKLEFVYVNWPRHGRPRAGMPPPIIGWDGEACCETLIAECRSAGLWDPFNKARGPGASLGEDGELVLHCGNRVLIVHPDKPGPNGPHVEDMKPGSFGEHVYPAFPPLRRPEDYTAKPGMKGPVGEVLALLHSWNWKRPELDPVLALGWIGCALIGGALAWRPLMWVTGNAGSGKSTFQEFVGGLLRDRLLQSSDASAAGVWQTLGISTNAVGIDEGEPEEAGDRRMQAMIKFARQAASGGLILRGGADHVGSAFKARSCFLFSSILVPRLQGQDRTRFMVCELKPLKDRKDPTMKLNVSSDDMKRLGDALLSRIVMGWWRWKDTLAAYKAELMAVGLTARAADLWGNTFAAYDLFLFDEEKLEERAKEWAGKIIAAKAHAFGAEVENEEFLDCCDEILSHVPDYFRGGVKSRVDALIRHVLNAHLLPPDPTDSTAREELAKAESALANCGLRVTFDITNLPEPALAVRTTGQGIAKIFAHTKWAGGVWSQALARNKFARKAKIRIGGSDPRLCILLPLAQILDDTAEESAEAETK